MGLILNSLFPKEEEDISAMPDPGKGIDNLLKKYQFAKQLFDEDAGDDADSPSSNAGADDGILEGRALAPDTDAGQTASGPGEQPQALAPATVSGGLIGRAMFPYQEDVFAPDAQYPAGMEVSPDVAGYPPVAVEAPGNAVSSRGAAAQTRTAAEGDSISRLLQSSDPQAIGDFMRANGLNSSSIIAGREYLVPGTGIARPDKSSAGIGQLALDEDNLRLAAQRRQKTSPATTTVAAAPVGAPAAPEQAKASAGATADAGAAGSRADAQVVDLNSVPKLLPNGLLQDGFRARDTQNKLVDKVMTIDRQRNKLILMQPSDKSLYESGLGEKGAPGYLKVFGHASEERLQGLVTGKEVANVIKKSGLWDEKNPVPIMLDACNSGKIDEGIASDVAKNLHTYVTGPTTSTWNMPLGGPAIGQGAFEAMPGILDHIRNVWKPGTWRTYGPDGKAIATSMQSPRGDNNPLPRAVYDFLQMTKGNPKK